MRTHSHEFLSITTLLAALAAGCSLPPELGTSAPSGRLFTSVDPSGDDSNAGDDTGDLTSDDADAGDPTGDDADAADPTGDDATDPVTTPIGAVLAGGTGLIIPAYLAIDGTQQDSWTAIAAGAATLLNGTSTYKDYWVAVTAGASGEKKQDVDWMAAKAAWDPVRANGGKIFGYVHTGQTPTSLLFRPIVDVEADIVSWVAGYPNIDGIWIDEFYPRHEIADDVGPPTIMFPNGRMAAPPPGNPSYVSPDGGLNPAVNIDPAGGYYATLRDFIRNTYSNLKIIGNAGGKLWSNQQDYAKLVDVICTFEQTYQSAAANNWKNLQRQNDASPYSELALIHTNPNDMAGALQKAFAFGYTHAYTTDVPYEIGDAGQNVWGALPSYFADEVSTVAGPP
jgi:hypothetical protein